MWTIFLYFLFSLRFHFTLILYRNNYHPHLSTSWWYQGTNKNILIYVINTEQRIVLKIVLCDQITIHSEIFSHTNQIKARLWSRDSTETCKKSVINVHHFPLFFSLLWNFVLLWCFLEITIIHIYLFTF